MSQMQLKSITLSDFRGFGTNHTLQLPQGPGVTILSGSNGLGKSTVLEAIEWALTGKILRLSNVSVGALDHSALHRHNAKINPSNSGYSVKLIFSSITGEDYSIHRAIGFKDGAYNMSATPSFADIQKVLVGDDWTVPAESIGTYLHLTHIQSQSSSTRFSGLDPKEQWQRLRGPAGLNQLSIAQERIANTTRAFNEEILRSNTQIDLLSNDLESWKSTLNNREILKQRQSISAVLTPEQAVIDLLVLVKKHSLPELPVGSEINPKNIEVWARELIENLTAKHLAKSNEVLEINNILDLPQRVRDVEYKIEAGKSELNLLTEEQNQHLKSIEENSKLVTSLNSFLDEATINSKNLRKQIDAYQEIERSYKKMEELDLIIAELNNEFKSVSLEITKYENELKDPEDKLKERRSKTSQLSVINTSIKDAEALIERVKEHHALTTQISAKNPAKDLLKNNIELARVRITSLDQEIETKSQLIVTKNRNLIEAKKDAGEFQAAISTVISKISEHDRQCPVCLTDFDRGSLLQQAKKAATLSRANLLPLENEISELKLIVEAKRIERQQTHSDYLAQSSSILNLEIQEKKHLAELTELLRHPLLSGSDIGQAMDTIERSRKKLLKELSEINNMLSILPDESSLLARIAELKSNIEVSSLKRLDIKNRQEKARQDRTAVDLSLSNPRALLQRELLSVDEIIKTSAEVQNKLDDSNRNVDEIRQKLGEVVAKVNSLNLNTNKITSKVTELKNRIKALSDQRSLFSMTWKKFEPNLELNESEIDKLLARTKRIINDLGMDLKSISQIMERLQSWGESQELNIAQKNIDDILIRYKSTSETEETNRREAVLRDAKLYFKKCQAVKDGVDWLKTALSDETDRYAKEVLDPLNELHNKYLLALTAGRRWSVRNDARITNRRTELNMRVSWNDTSLKDTDKSIPANQILSEGQMAAVTLSQMLAMSSAYRWSKWRALLLDDPTQHNDLIHSSSFIEVLRNLALYQGYQILLCTHDLEEAAFIKRKLAASKIKTTEIRFLGHEINGVKTDSLYQ